MSDPFVLAVAALAGFSIWHNRRARKAMHADLVAMRADRAAMHEDYERMKAIGGEWR